VTFLVVACSHCLGIFVSAGVGTWAEVPCYWLSSVLLSLSIDNGFVLAAGL